MAGLDGKVAIVTGASRGIGRALAKLFRRKLAQRLGQDGATIIVNYNKGKQEADEVVAQIQTGAGQAVAIPADMSQITQIRRLFQDTLDKFNRVDILVNNSGMGGKQEAIAEVTEESFDRVFTLNVKGVLFALQEAARNMSEGGRIINLSSSTTIFPTPGLAVYIASKAASKVFTEVLAKELGSRGITVNSVMPGPTIPGMFEWAPPDFRAQAAASSPFGRLGQPGDIADVVAFLASDDARWITGQHILANGGATI